MNRLFDQDYARRRAEHELARGQAEFKRAIRNAGFNLSPIEHLHRDNGFTSPPRAAAMRIQGLALGLLLSLPIWGAIGVAGKRFGFPHLALGVFFGLIGIVALVTIGQGVVRACQWLRDR